tara:strand:+ start:126 stop:1124 length:999 start_codon:yes stop_codon:yes gene_type:complete
MKIVLVQRPSGSGFSLEAVYGAIHSELSQKIDIAPFKFKKNNFFKDLLELRKMKADLYHITGDIHYLTLFLPKNKSVLTIHDIGRYLYDLKGIKKWIYKIFWISLPIFFSGAIFFSSEVTKKRVQKITTINKKPNFVAKLCTNLEFKDYALNRNEEKPYILHVGTAAHKNLLTVIKAIEKIECKLLIVGELSEADRCYLNDKDIDFKNFVNINKKELEGLYLKADLVTFPSFHEGFGLPIIEGQASKTPVITSNFSPMSEVAGQGAILINPYNVNEMKDSINKVLTDLEFTKKLVKRGSDNAKLYSTEVVASNHHAFYQLILDSTTKKRREV